VDIFRSCSGSSTCQRDEPAVMIMQMIVNIIRVLVVSLSRTAVTVAIQTAATTTVLHELSKVIYRAGDSIVVKIQAKKSVTDVLHC